MIHREQNKGKWQHEAFALTFPLAWMISYFAAYYSCLCQTSMDWWIPWLLMLRLLLLLLAERVIFFEWGKDLE